MPKGWLPALQRRSNNSVAKQRVPNSVKQLANEAENLGRFWCCYITSVNSTMCNLQVLALAKASPVEAGT